MKRSTRRRLTIAGINLAVVAVVALVAYVVDWGTVRTNFWNPEGTAFDGGNWGELITTGAVNTVKYTAIAFIGGFTLALLLALAKLSPISTLRWLATAYIEFFRGLPALIVIIFVGLGLPIAVPGWNPPGGFVGSGLIALILVAGAYIAETLRAGIQAVPAGQAEAARSLGMSGSATTVKVVLPQAFRIVIPPLTNEFVLLIKDTALLSVIGVQVGQRELTTVARDALSSGPSAQTSTSLIQAALLYLVITIPLTQLVAWQERRQRKATR